MASGAITEAPTHFSEDSEGLCPSIIPEPAPKSLHPARGVGQIEEQKTRHATCSYAPIQHMDASKTREMHRTSLHFPPVLYKRLRLLAVEKDTTVTEVVIEAVERYLKTEEPKVRRIR